MNILQFIHGCDIILLMGISWLLKLKKKMVWGFIFNDKLVKTFEIFHIPKLNIYQTTGEERKTKCIFVTIVTMK